MTLRAAEFWPLFERLDERGWVDYTYNDAMEDIEAELHWEEDPSNIPPLPATPLEYYDRYYLKRRLSGE